MKSKKAICIIICAGLVITIAALTKDVTSTAVHYAMCVASFILASIAIRVEKTMKNTTALQEKRGGE